MTNDELLAGFLDRSLSEDELLEFETRQQDNPAFAEEVQRMVTTEELLQGAAPTVKYPVGFLATIESSVAARLVAASTAATAGAIATKSIWSGAWAWITTGIGALAIGAGITWFVTQQPTSVQQQQPIPHLRTAQQQHTPQQPAISQQPAVVPQQQQLVQPPGNQMHVQPGVSDRHIRIDSTPDAVTQLKQKLVECKQSADKNMCGHINRALGNELRKRNKYQEAKPYLEAALLYGQQSGIKQFEMDAHGELGLLAQAQGNTQLATEHFTNAVTFGKANNLDVTRWKKALEK